MHIVLLWLLSLVLIRSRKEKQCIGTFVALWHYCRIWLLLSLVNLRWALSRPPSGHNKCDRVQHLSNHKAFVMLSRHYMAWYGGCSSEPNVSEITPSTLALESRTVDPRGSQTLGVNTELCFFCRILNVWTCDGSAVRCSNSLTIYCGIIWAWYDSLWFWPYGATLALSRSHW